MFLSGLWAAVTRAIFLGTPTFNSLVRCSPMHCIPRYILTKKITHKVTKKKTRSSRHPGIIPFVRIYVEPWLQLGLSRVQRARHHTSAEEPSSTSSGSSLPLTVSVTAASPARELITSGYRTMPTTTLILSRWVKYWKNIISCYLELPGLYWGRSWRHH